MDSVAISSRLVTIVVVAWCMSFLSSTVQAQSNVNSTDTDLVQTAASKSESDRKPPIDEAHPLYKLLEVAYKARAGLDDVEDYRCLFTKKELLRNNKLQKSTMLMKFREKPFSVYLSCIKPDPNEGREIIYVQGKNANMMLVHEGGLKGALGTFKIDPAGSDALAENKYPITSIGMKYMLDSVIKTWEAEGKYAGITPQMRKAKLPTGEECMAYEALHEHFKQFKFHTTRLYIDNQTGLAIGLQQYGFPMTKDQEPPLVEEYFYLQLKVNQKLSDVDFDPKNPKYAFR